MSRSSADFHHQNHVQTKMLFFFFFSLHVIGYCLQKWSFISFTKLSLQSAQSIYPQQINPYVCTMPKCLHMKGLHPSYTKISIAQFLTVILCYSMCKCKNLMKCVSINATLFSHCHPNLTRISAQSPITSSKAKFSAIIFCCSYKGHFLWGKD